MKLSIFCVVIFLVTIGCSNRKEAEEFTTSMISVGERSFTGETIDSLAIFSIKCTNSGYGVRGEEEKKDLLGLRIEVSGDSNFISTLTSIFLIDGDSIFATKNVLSNPIKFDSISYQTSSTIFRVGCQRKAGEKACFTLSIDNVKMQYMTGASDPYSGVGGKWFENLGDGNMKYDSTGQTRGSSVILD